MATRKSRLLRQYTERYGPTMDMKAIADAFGVQRQSIYNMISQERMPFDVFQLKGIGSRKGKRFAHTRDVVRYLEGQLSFTG